MGANECVRNVFYWEMLPGQMVLEQPDCLLGQNTETGRVMT